MHLKVFVYTCRKVISIKAIRHLHLFKGDSVELALKDIDLLHIVILAPDEVALPSESQLCILGARRRLVLLGVVKNQERNPQPLYVFKRQSVLGPSLLQVQILDTVVIPLTTSFPFALNLHFED